MFFFGLAAGLGILSFTELQNKAIYSLLSLWLVFFIVNALNSAQEVTFKPWSMFGDDPSVQVYFSPTCHRCEEVVTEILDNYVNPNGIAFYPVAKDYEDLRRLAAALPLLKEPGREKEAIRALFKPADPSAQCSGLSLRDHFRLWCNKIHLAKMGLSTVPKVISSAPLKMRDPLPFESGPAPFFPDQKDETCSPFGEEPCP